MFGNDFLLRIKPYAVLRIRDVYPIPDQGSDFFPSRIRIKELEYFNPKICF